MRAAAKKHNKAAVSPRLLHREVSGRQRMTPPHHVVRTDAADRARFCTWRQKQERLGDKRQQISVAGAKLNLNLNLNPSDFVKSNCMKYCLKFKNHTFPPIVIRQKFCFHIIFLYANFFQSKFCLDFYPQTKLCPSGFFSVKIFCLPESFMAFKSWSFQQISQAYRRSVDFLDVVLTTWKCLDWFQLLF